MQIDSPETLIGALRASELFTQEQLLAIAQELSALGSNVQILLRHLVQKNRLTVYQLRKVINGKAAELFLGPYVISDKIGEGGMGKVFRARQVRLGREVALKVVRSHLLANPIVRKRYDREVETASALNHPNIVGVFDAGEVDGKYYLAMEFVDGIDLARLVRDYRSLEIAEACEYARQAALGLQYAHEQGFVHRDVKPSNIVVAGERHVPQATEPAVVKILDMGLVRTVGFDDGGAGGGDLTRAGTVVGTPDYMAPEQAKNSSGVDHRADLYSLGCTLYFLLTARAPFPTGTAIEKLLQHQLEAPTPIQALRREVPTTVAEVVSRLIAKKPDDRFPTAGSVAQALASLSRYPDGSLPVPIRVRWDSSPNRTADSLPQAGRSTLPTGVDPGSSSQGSTPSAQSDPLAQPVAPRDDTPQPLGLPPTLHATVESNSPFSSLSEPPSGPINPVAPAQLQTQSQRPSTLRRTVLWVAAAIGVLIAVGLGLWAAFGDTAREPHHTLAVPENSPPPDVIPKPPARPGIVPTVNLTRLHNRLDLIPAGAGLVVITYPSAFLKEKDSPFTRGSGPGKLASWTDRLNVDTALPLARSDRVVFSVPGGTHERFLLVSEGDYLTTGFGNVLAGHPKLRTPKDLPKVPPTVKPYAAPGNRYTALIAPPTGAPVYALATGPPLLERLISHLMLAARNATPPRLDAGMLAALTAPTENPPPLIFAVAGPTFQLPFSDSPTLQDFQITLITMRVRISERMELELAVTGARKEAVQQFLATVSRKIREEYPLDGRPVANLLSQATRTEEEVDGKFRLVLKANWTPEQWSAFLDRLFAR